MKRNFLTLCLGLAFAAAAFAQKGPKYVFYFIGDGMGVNQVNATETYLAAVEGHRGIKPLTFPSFPNVALVNTQSDSHGITDSAAGGTALATGRKTYNNAIGVLPEYEGHGFGRAMLEQMHERAREQGAERILLEVRADNPRAQRLYERNGYRAIHVRRGYYDDGTNAIIMECTF